MKENNPTPSHKLAISVHSTWTVNKDTQAPAADYGDGARIPAGYWSRVVGGAFNSGYFWLLYVIYWIKTC